MNNFSVCRPSLIASAEQELAPWEQEWNLSEFSAIRVRLSHGFLRADPSALFPKVAEYWYPMFAMLQCRIEQCATRVSLEFPGDLDRVTAAELDGEVLVIGTDASTESLIVEKLAPVAGSAVSEVLFEYFERRLLYSLRKGWNGVEELKLNYLTGSRDESIDVLGVIELSLIVNGERLRFVFGLGPQSVSRIDAAWRQHLLQTSAEPVSGDLGNIHKFTLVSNFLQIDSKSLVEFLSPGALIFCGAPLSETLVLQCDGEPWAFGHLGLFKGKYAVELEGFKPVLPTPEPNSTLVSLEIASAELDSEAKLEHSSEGAILVTRASAGSEAKLSIQGEQVATVSLHRADGQLALRVISLS